MDNSLWWVRVLVWVNPRNQRPAVSLVPMGSNSITQYHNFKVSENLEKQSCLTLRDWYMSLRVQIQPPRRNRLFLFLSLFPTKNKLPLVRGLQVTKQSAALSGCTLSLSDMSSGVLTGVVIFPRYPCSIPHLSCSLSSKWKGWTRGTCRGFSLSYAEDREVEVLCKSIPLGCAGGRPIDGLLNTPTLSWESQVPRWESHRKWFHTPDTGEGYHLDLSGSKSHL